ncbi:3' 5' exonuclease [Fusarium heterosporum]|uniref:3' 5' exonuclease n=1 Tax=Fusarium heterosporum TaxID=42747 RepID=A0A8H5TE60_FUSHE|nr:3' 5' exonuclease [Fusarium heterosporum]
MNSTPSTIETLSQGNGASKMNIVSVDQLKGFLQDLDGLSNKPTSIFVDASGIGQNALTDLQVGVPSTNTLYIVNLVRLGTTALSKVDESYPSLRAILESGKIWKAGFDIRDLSRLLYNQFNLSLGGIYDLQLMELASRDDGKSKKFLAGFAKCVDQDIPGSNDAKLRWLTPSISTNMHMFNSLGHVTRHSMRRVELFSVLWAIYRHKLARAYQAFWLASARGESEQRVIDSKKKRVEQKDQHLGPMCWWDLEQLEAATDNWNDEIYMESQTGDYKLDEDAEWVPTRR